MEVSCFEKFEIRSKLSSWRRFENFPILYITTSNGLIRFWLIASYDPKNLYTVHPKMHENVDCHIGQGIWKSVVLKFLKSDRNEAVGKGLKIFRF